MSTSDRIAGAPISWGVCEAPGWGYEIAPGRVLTEMRDLGIVATELGPEGYLGTTSDAVRARLARHGMRLVGGFVPVTMHTDAAFDLAGVTNAIEVLASGGAEVAVLAARSADGSYDRRVTLSDDEWIILLRNLERVRSVVEEHGLTAALHPHVGTAIEDRASVLRLLESSDVQLCLDTGHLLIGGMAPTELLELAPDRIAHVHLKDVDATVAAAVADATIDYMGAVRAGLYRPLGAGDVGIASVVGALTEAGYPGWYVLEQDCRLDTEPAAGGGPVDDVRASIAFLRAIAG